MKPEHIAVSIAGLILVMPFLALAFPSLIGTSQTFVVTSGSMEPAISTGSIIWVSDTPPSQIEKGDVITFSQGSGNTVTHRVVNVSEDPEYSFKTKGDANPEPDPGRVQAEQLIGEVNYSVPYLGYVAEWISSSIGLILLVVIPALGIIGLELTELYKNMKDEQGEDYSGF